MVSVTLMSRRDSHACHGDTRGRDTPSPPKGGVGGVTTAPAWVAGPTAVEHPLRDRFPFRAGTGQRDPGKPSVPPAEKFGCQRCQGCQRLGGCHG